MSKVICPYCNEQDSCITYSRDAFAIRVENPGINDSYVFEVKGCIKCGEFFQYLSKERKKEVFKCL